MNKRMERADAKIMAEIANAIYDLNDPRLFKELITVSEVKTSSDFGYCKVKISILTQDLELKKKILQILQKSSGHIKRTIAKKLDMRNVPELSFSIDEGASHSENINEILKSLNIPKEENEHKI